MGLLDSVLGQVLGGGAQQSGGGMGNLGPLAGMLGGLLADNGSQGGLGGLVSKFTQAGLGDAVNSWVGTGANAPVTGDQLHNALGTDVVSGMASKLGINVATLLPMLVTILPQVINHLTPSGQVPAQGVGNHDDLLASLTGLLQKA